MKGGAPRGKEANLHLSTCRLEDLHVENLVASWLVDFSLVA